MKKRLKNGILAVLVLFGTVLLIPSAEAKRGCCSWHGGVSYCASNGRYMCNDGTYSPTCTCSNGSYNSYNSYSYTPTYSYKPSCTDLYGIGAVSNGNNTCSCGYWYTRGKDNRGNDKCVWGDTYCTNLYGIYAEFVEETKSCQCQNGYYFNQQVGECRSINDLCQEYFGYGAEYDGNKGCKCKWNYYFDGEKCTLG